MALPATSALPDRVRRFLAEPRFAIVGTIDEDGAPRQAVTWFLLDGDTVVINSREGRRWPTNLRRDPRITIAITEPSRESWVGLTGTVQIVDDQEQAQADIAAMAHRFNGPDSAEAADAIATFQTQQRVTFRLRPTGIHDHVEE